MATRLETVEPVVLQELQQGIRPKKRRRHALFEPAVFHFPANITTKRELLFDPPAPPDLMILSLSEFHLLWPFIDNVRSSNRKNNTTKVGRQCTYFIYRLWRPEHQSEANGKRNKYIRAVPRCGMKLNVVSIF